MEEAKRDWLTKAFGISWNADEADASAREAGGGEDAKTGEDAKGGRKKSSRKRHLTPQQMQDIARRLPEARKAYNAAMSEVAAQLDEIKKTLRKSPDPDLRDIAEHGLGDITGGFKIIVDQYVAQISGGQDEAKMRKTAAKLLEAANEFSQMLLSDERVTVLDENPFSTVVTIRDTLVPAVLGLADAARV